MQSSRTQGRLIVFEGTEGVGKSTQLKLLKQWLEQEGWHDRINAPIVVTRQPGGTDLGQQLRRLLLDTSLTEGQDLHILTELFIYAADRVQHVHVVLRPALIQGSIVLCDRYTASTVAYQGYGEGLSPELIQQLNTLATEGLVPDLTFWLDIEVEEGLERVRQRQAKGSEFQKDRMEAKSLWFHKSVHEGFRIQAADNPEGIVRIDAALPQEEVAGQIQAVIEQRLQEWYPKT
jgi:dTMP kinase